MADTPPPSQPDAGATADAPADERTKSDKIEVWIAALLGVVAILTAFATYKSVLEDGDTLAKFNEGIRFTNQASERNTAGLQEYSTDQQTYLEFIKSERAGDEEISAYFRETLFSPELEEGVKWVEKGIDDPEVVSPFQEDSPYNRPEWDEAAKFDDQAAASFKQAGVHDEDGDKYVLATVFLSISLFLLGIAGVNRQYRVQRALAILATVVLTGGVIQILAVGL